ncbi:MAG: hypothetical protein NTW19_16685 [Planctomycetota bacterium]|nr:hypothetical protein [Planctomycetota bacterium]
MSNQFRLLVLASMAAVGAICWINSHPRTVRVGMNWLSANLAIRAWYGVDITLPLLLNSQTTRFSKDASVGSAFLPEDDLEHPGVWYEMPDGTCLHLEKTSAGDRVESIEIGAPGQGYRSAQAWAAQPRRRVDRVNLGGFAANVVGDGGTVAVGMPLAEARYRFRYAGDISAVINDGLVWNGGERYPVISKAFHYELSGSNGVILYGCSPTRDDVGFRVASITIGSHSDLWDKQKRDPHVQRVEEIRPPGFWDWNNFMSPTMVLAYFGAAWILVEYLALRERRRAKRAAAAG